MFNLIVLLLGISIAFVAPSNAQFQYDFNDDFNDDLSVVYQPPRRYYPQATPISTYVQRPRALEKQFARYVNTFEAHLQYLQKLTANFKLYLQATRNSNGRQRQAGRNKNQIQNTPKSRPPRSFINMPSRVCQPGWKKDRLGRCREVFK